MSKGNLFLGLGSGKIGDAVLYRANGEQIARTRVRHPYNPRSNAQLYQRAIMATVLQAYSSGAQLYDHSFQGYGAGNPCMRRFMSLNLRDLRARVRADLAVGNGTTARVVGPKVNAPVPWSGMWISQGSYDNNVLPATEGDADNGASFALPAASGSETVAAYASRVGLVTDDLYTIVLYSVTSDDAADALYIVDSDSPTGMQMPIRFGFIRLRVRDLSAVTSTAVSATWSTLFTIDKTSLPLNAWMANNCFASGGTATAVSFTNLVPDDAALGAMGIIRSRENEDLRSNSRLVWAGIGNGFGLTSPYLLSAWRNIASVGDSSLILEGGSF